MCQFFSAVATKDKLYAYYGVDSHSDILALANIKDDTDIRIEQPKFVKLELIPNNPMTLEFEKVKNQPPDLTAGEFNRGE